MYRKIRMYNGTVEVVAVRYLGNGMVRLYVVDATGNLSTIG